MKGRGIGASPCGKVVYFQLILELAVDTDRKPCVRIPHSCFRRFGFHCWSPKMLIPGLMPWYAGSFLCLQRE